MDTFWVGLGGGGGGGGAGILKTTQNNAKLHSCTVDIGNWVQVKTTAKIIAISLLSRNFTIFCVHNTNCLKNKW